jgi:cytochrome c553
LKRRALAVVVLIFLHASIYTGSSAKMPGNTIPQKDADPNFLFTRNCASCHGKDGRAKTFKAKFNHAQDLVNANWQASITDEHMLFSILRGKGRMPAFRKKLSENEIAALVTYVRMLKR